MRGDHHDPETDLGLGHLACARSLGERRRRTLGWSGHRRAHGIGDGDAKRVQALWMRAASLS